MGGSQGGGETSFPGKKTKEATQKGHQMRKNELTGYVARTQKASREIISSEERIFMEAESSVPGNQQQS